MPLRFTTKTWWNQVKFKMTHDPSPIPPLTFSRFWPHDRQSDQIHSPIWPISVLTPS